MSCKCISIKSQTVSQLVDSNPRFVDFLSDKQLAIIERLVSIDVYKIQSYLIEGTENEYSNKSAFIKTLSEEEMTLFLNSIIKDTNYSWGDSNSISFNPNIQFVLKEANEQFLILYSENSKTLGVIDLEGQKTISVKSVLHKYLTKLLL